MISLRLLWTWDHCTQWTAARAGVHDWGASNEFSGRTEDFLREYSLLLRWCGQHGIDGVVVCGLPRDGHGGVEAAKRLCEVPDEAGVDGPVSIAAGQPYNMQEFSIEDLQREGVARASLPTVAILASVQALRAALSGIRDTLGFDHLTTPDRLCSWRDIADIIGK